MAWRSHPDNDNRPGRERLRARIEVLNESCIGAWNRLMPLMITQYLCCEKNRGKGFNFLFLTSGIESFFTQVTDAFEQFYKDDQPENDLDSINQLILSRFGDKPRLFLRRPTAVIESQIGGIYFKRENTLPISRLQQIFEEGANISPQKSEEQKQALVWVLANFARNEWGALLTSERIISPEFAAEVSPAQPQET